MVDSGVVTTLDISPVRTEVSGEALRASVMPTMAEVRAARRRLHVKGVGVAIAALVSYVTILVPGVVWYVRLAAFPILVVALIMVATSVMHDANHRAFFAGSIAANNAVGYASDLLGVSSVLWRIKHDIHHAHTNVQGIDVDIDQGIVARLAPQQQQRWWHRFQHLYLWPLYGLLGVQWLLVSDFADLRRGRIGTQSLSVVTRNQRVGIVLGKMLHIGWAIAIPMLSYQWWQVALGYLVTSWCMGVVLAVTFQIAHCVDTAEFMEPSASRRDDDFVWHQLLTTVNVAPNASLLGRFRSLVLGGLDYQIEHHLAPEIPHTAYASMAKQLRSSCTSADIRYRSHRNVAGAVRSHYRWLRCMATSGTS